MNPPTEANIGHARFLCGPTSPDVEATLSRLQGADDVQYVAVMPDVHLAEEICIGTVLATSHLLYPNAVGGDIGCGMAAIRLDVEASCLDDERIAGRLLQGLYQRVPSNRHRRDAVVDVLPNNLQARLLSADHLERLKGREGRFQFGTLGRGNHFLECQADQEGALWLMVHSGSRAMGQAIRSHHLSHATVGTTGMPYLDADQPEGQAYLQDMNWALDYAMASRDAMLNTAIELLQALVGSAPIEDSHHNLHHNHVVRETHFSQPYWVHRKGANAAGRGVPGIIPGSMGTESFLVVGRGEPTSLASSSHGAGRALSRKAAHQQISQKALSQQMDGIWYDHRKRRTLVDEAPAAYKNIRAVMRAQRDLVRIVTTLSPVLSFKG